VSDPSAPSSSSRSAPLILIVDDHTDSRDLYELGLGACGFTTHGVASAREVFDMALTSQPDAIVTDLAMPETDGFSLIHRLKADPRTCDIPVVAVSGHAGAQTRLEVLAVGAQAFLPKPCSVAELAAALWRVLAVPPPSQ
jgi:CheY-like chemotaxis protein